ncbi:DUF5362 family protein [Flavobacterium sp. UMI-01]|uniref:DUF5362 family protein n=1 Tax=Flavobacterium sp. UMI-01 TaxID=1441053 RepID=UPI001C7D60A1|nr:DUF5362 family protein [Flavobacterium sp. UMI-01]GIZ08633.1 hypothetical protein FUMI01_13600 [Flavobacterium sp. UMI-01]
MEENYNETELKPIFDLSLEAQGFLKETAKWGYFLSILGFVFIGLIVIVAFFIGSIFSKFNSIGNGINPMMGISGGIFSVIYLLIGLVYFFPVYYLFKFSSKVKNAFKFSDNQQLNASFEYLKSHYKFMGIVALIFLSFYVVVFFMTFIVGIISSL